MLVEGMFVRVLEKGCVPSHLIYMHQKGCLIREDVQQKGWVVMCGIANNYMMNF